MYGAIIGDIVGSTREGVFRNVKKKDFQLFKEGSKYTDDTVMTIAVAKALIESNATPDLFQLALPNLIKTYGRNFPDVGYSTKFRKWLKSNSMEPYNSYGNGAAMRVSPCGLMAKSLDEAVNLAIISSRATHNHYEAVEGAMAVASAIYMAKTGSGKDEIKEHIEEHYYELDKTIDEIRPRYRFTSSSKKTVPVAIEAFLESQNFEDAVRTAVSVGGDSDTIAAIAGSIAWTFYGGINNMTSCMEKMKDKAKEYLPEEFKIIISQLYSFCG